MLLQAMNARLARKRMTKRRQFAVKVKRAARCFEVWLCPDGDMPELAGMIDARLAADARHHGQDLVGELVEQAMKQAERRRNLGECAPGRRHP